MFNPKNYDERIKERKEKVKKFSDERKANIIKKYLLSEALKSRGLRQTIAVEDGINTIILKDKYYLNQHVGYPNESLNDMMIRLGLISHEELEIDISKFSDDDIFRMTM